MEKKNFILESSKSEFVSNPSTLPTKQFIIIIIPFRNDLAESSRAPPERDESSLVQCDF